jgi:thiol:disulfide interchange protein DsbD
MITYRFIFHISLLLTLSAGAIGQFDDDPFTRQTSQPSFLPVEQAYQLDSSFEADGTLRLHWEITEGYYLYRHAFKFVDGNSDQTVNAQVATGLAKHDEYFGDVEVYYQSADAFIDRLPADLNLLAVTSQGCADAGLCYPPRTQYIVIDSSKQLAHITNTATANIGTPATDQTSSSISLIYALLLAFTGGIVLNLMPCVFPVLSLKVLGFASDKQHRQWLHGVSYSSGVVLSFIAVAGLMLALRSAGQAIGWGFQLQTPWFVAALCYLFFVMGLSLSGFVELGGRWMGLGNKLASKSGYNGSFFTGVLATVVASPCTAPFMGTALGFAMTQYTSTALLIFAALGLGMALPVLALSCSPKLLAKLPKPGAWMDRLKQLLAFPLYGAALWLCWVVGKQTGATGMLTVMSGCLLLAFALWLWRAGTVAKTAAAIAAAAAISLLSSSLLSVDGTESDDTQTYTPERLSQLRANGQTVFVNLTADWCITCLANEKLALSTDAVQQAFNKYNIYYLKGDWTNYDPVITDLLEQHQRSGVPLYLLYPPQQEPVVLPQLLSSKTIIGYLEKHL